MAEEDKIINKKLSTNLGIGVIVNSPSKNPVGNITPKKHIKDYNQADLIEITKTNNKQKNSFRSC